MESFLLSVIPYCGEIAIKLWITKDRLFIRKRK